MASTRADVSVPVQPGRAFPTPRPLGRSPENSARSRARVITSGQFSSLFKYLSVLNIGMVCADAALGYGEFRPGLDRRFLLATNETRKDTGDDPGSFARERAATWRFGTVPIIQRTSVGDPPRLPPHRRRS